MKARRGTTQLAARLGAPSLIAALVVLLALAAGSPAQDANCSERTDVPGATEANDTMNGSDSHEIFNALGGDDTVLALGGSDCVFGGAGNDDLDGGAGGDFIDGSTGADTIDGGADDDQIQGDDFNVDVGENDFILGGSGAELIEGHGGRDTIDAGSGNDDVGGGQGRDKVKAGAGNDRVSSRDGYAETIDCGPGKDVLRADTKDKGVGCETIHRQPNPFPAMVKSTGDDRTTFSLRWENVAGLGDSYRYYVTITGPCGTITKSGYGYGKVSILKFKPQRFGKSGRWCTGTYKVKVEVQQYRYPDPNPPLPKYLFGRTSFKVKG